MNGVNQGTGFGAWNLTDNNDNGTTVFAGYFLGDSTAGAGDINTSGQSFGIYANPGSAFATATRAFSSPMAVGATLQLQLGVNFDNGNKGITLSNLSQGEIFGFNIGFGASVASSNGTLNPTSASYDYGGAASLQMELTMDSASRLSYSVTRTSPQGTQGVLFEGSVTGLTSAPDFIRFYNSGTDDGSSQNNLYFNSLLIVPEPGTPLLILSGFGLFCFLRRRK